MKQKTKDIQRKKEPIAKMYENMRITYLCHFYMMEHVGAIDRFQSFVILVFK